MKKLFCIALCLMLLPAAFAEKSPAEDFLTNLGKTWDSFLVMTEDAAHSVSEWADESGVTAWFDEAGKNIEAWANDSGLTEWANTALNDIQTWADDSGLTEWAQNVSAEVNTFVEENGPAVEAWLKGAGDDVKHAWDTLVNADQHTQAEVEAALETVTEALAPAEATGPAYLGTWVCGRAAIVVTDEHPGYRVEITWGSSAAEVSEWSYYCPYDLVNGSLVSEATGTRMDLTYGEDGKVAESVTAYTDGTATFSLDGAGRLLWADDKEDAGADMAFERAAIVGVAPSAEEFTVGYFRMLGDEALSLDKAACEALNFAVSSELWLADIETLRANMLEAWESLTPEEQAAFDGRFMDVVRLLDACFDDWSANRAAFTDGREARMDELTGDPLYERAWATLRDHTLTLGNSDS